MNFDAYKSDKYLFPSRNVDPKLKLSKDYVKKMAEAVFSAYVGDKCGVPYSLLGYYDEIRQYSDGKQDPSKYEETQTDTDVNGRVISSVDGDWTSQQNKRKGTGNLNKEILSLAPRIMQAILGAFEKVDYNLVADMIDPDSGYEKDKLKSKLYAESQNLDFINTFKQQAGIPIQTDTKYPKDLDELQLMDDLGEFKTGIAKALEKLLEHTYDISDWDNDKVKLLKDIVCFNACCLKDYYDQEDNKWKTCYEDISRIIAQYSDKRDYNDSSYYGVIREVTVGEIRNLVEGEYDEAEISQLAQSWQGQLGNPAKDKWAQFNEIDEYGNWKFDFYKCIILDFTWMENDMIYKTVNISRRGIRTIYDQDFGKVRNTEHNKTRVTTIKKRYEAKWAVGTNIIFENRISPSQPKDKNNKRPLFPYHIYVGTEKSIMQRLVPVFDQFQISWLKLQQSLIDDWGDLTLIDQTVVDRMQVKGETWDTLKILKHAKRTKILPFRSLPISGKYPGGAIKPLERIPSTVMTKIEESIALFENCIRMTEMVTGINPMVLGQQPSGKEGLGTTQIAIENTSKILKPIIDSIFVVKKSSAIFLSEAIRLTVRNDKKSYDAYARVVGTNDVDALKESEYEARELGIKLTPRPTTEEMQSLYQDIETASLPGKDGAPLIDFATKMYIKEKLMRGANLSDLRLYLSNAIEKEKQRQAKEQRQIMELQSQQNQQLQQQKMQGEAIMKQESDKIEMNKIAFQHANSMELETLKIQGKSQEDARK